MKQIKFYYGLSGTFKTSTILNEKSRFVDYESPVVWSMIKQWKDLENNEFAGLVESNHLNFALLHLCNLGNIIKSSNNEDIILVERGVTDPLYYWTAEDITSVDEKWVNTIVEKEYELCDGENSRVEKILLIQKDADFIDKVILAEPHRREIFPNVESYLKKQEDYVTFTKKYNKITQTIIIDSAEDYLNSLGITFNK